MGETIARPLSGLERVWLAAARLAPPFAIHLVVEWPGSIEPARWQAAVEAAAGPGMRLRLRGALGRARWVLDPAAPPVTVVDGPWRGDGPAPWLDAPLDAATGPVRVQLVPAEPGAAVSRVVFSAHHAVTDGRGLWRFVQDTAQALAGEVVEPPPAGPLTDAALARALGVEPLRPMPDTAAPLCPVPLDAPVTWRRRRLPPRSMVLPRLAAAFAADADLPVRLGVPVDLRRYQPGLDSSANLSGILHLDLPARPTPDAVRALVDAGVEARTAARHPLAADPVRGFPLWLMAAVGRVAARRQHRQQRFGVSLAISHLGRHALTIDGHPARVAFVPPGAPGLPLFVGVTADPAGVEVVAAGPLGADAIEALLDRVEAAWRAAD